MQNKGLGKEGVGSAPFCPREIRRFLRRHDEAF